MKNLNIRLVVLFGTFSIASVLVFQLYWIYNTYSVTSDQFNQRVKIALYRVAEEIADFTDTELPYNAVTQVTSNYFVVNQASSVDTKILGHYLKTVFEQHNITLDCEYAVYNCETNEMTYGNYLSGDDERRRPSPAEHFKKQEELVYYFGVIFPGKTSYILQSINIWILSSVIVFMSLVFFSYAIFIILKQKRLSEIQKDFIDNMAHEFKTPITSIAIAAHVLQEEGIERDRDRFRRYGAIVEDQNRRLEQHVEKVLQLATLERSREDIRKEWVDLHSVIAEVVRNMAEGHAEIVTVLEAPEPAVKADRLYLTNILYNLVDNAQKYGGQSPVIRIVTAGLPNGILLSVNDNGPGIPAKYIRRVFDKFFRVPTGNVHTVKGFGLGLYYVRRIVRDHGWKIRAESADGKGTTITIEIRNRP